MQNVFETGSNKLQNIYMDGMSVKVMLSKYEDLEVNFNDLRAFFQAKFPNLKNINYYATVFDDPEYHDRLKSFLKFLSHNGYTIRVATSPTPKDGEKPNRNNTNCLLPMIADLMTDDSDSAIVFTNNSAVKKICNEKNDFFDNLFVVSSFYSDFKEHVNAYSAIKFGDFLSQYKNYLETRSSSSTNAGDGDSEFANNKVVSI